MQIFVCCKQNSDTWTPGIPAQCLDPVIVRFQCSHCPPEYRLLRNRSSGIILIVTPLLQVSTLLNTIIIIPIISITPRCIPRIIPPAALTTLTSIPSLRGIFNDPALPRSRGSDKVSCLSRIKHIALCLNFQTNIEPTPLPADLIFGSNNKKVWSVNLIKFLLRRPCQYPSIKTDDDDVIILVAISMKLIVAAAAHPPPPQIFR